jgi:hypothetical protein
VNANLGANFLFNLGSVLCALVVCALVAPREFAPGSDWPRWHHAQGRMPATALELPPSSAVASICGAALASATQASSGRRRRARAIHGASSTRQWWGDHDIRRVNVEDALSGSTLVGGRVVDIAADVIRLRQ